MQAILRSACVGAVLSLAVIGASTLWPDIINDMRGFFGICAINLAAGVIFWTITVIKRIHPRTFGTYPRWDVGLLLFGAMLNLLFIGGPAILLLFALS